MAFDGVTISAVVKQLNDNVLNGRIDKIYQPEKDEIILNIRSFKSVYKLMLTSNPQSPRIGFTFVSKNNPNTPPLFCMVLRKHIQNGKIISITQPNFERIININIESINELGDYSVKTLILEMMGRHSNIILTDDKYNIIESIKHVNADMSSVRQVLPGLKYIIPSSNGKYDTMKIEKEIFMKVFEEKKSLNLQSFIYKSFNGISPIIASEIVARAGFEPSVRGDELNEFEKNVLYEKFVEFINKIKDGQFNPNIIYEDGKVVEFSPIETLIFKNFEKKYFDDISELLDFYYKKRDILYRMNQKSQDLKKLVLNNIERCVKKKHIQQKTLKEIKDRDKLRLFGELLTANIFMIKKGMTSFSTINFYDENMNEITIPLDANLTPSENAQRYFKLYSKQKRTFEALKSQIKQNDDELNYLEGVLESISNSTQEQDINEIRLELSEEGFLKKRNIGKNKHNIKKSKPIHYISSDGFNIFVGKNNRQNDELTLKTAKTNDMWLHTKNIPGSHVIIQSNGNDIPETTINEAALLAAFYSKGKNSSLVPVDYTLKKFVKKPAGAKPGMVIYTTNKTCYITPDEQLVSKIENAE